MLAADAALVAFATVVALADEFDPFVVLVAVATVVTATVVVFTTATVVAFALEFAF